MSPRRVVPDQAWRRPALAMFTVGYGANQFVPLLAVYRRVLPLSDAQATAVFGVYALGLVPGLLAGGRLSDRWGRRRLVLAFAAASLVATAVLITGRWGVAGLCAGRFLTGVVSGVVFTVGTAWVKELSAVAPPGAGPRRAALALTAGFGAGPLVAGVLARWAPAPEVLPYVVHLGLGAIALALLRPTPETRPPSPGPAGRLLPAAVRSRRFRRLVLPMAPWVFGSVTLAFTTLPAHGVGPVGPLGVAFPGLLAAVALLSGYLAQGPGRRLHAAVGTSRAAAAALAVVAVGCAVAALSAARPGVPTVTAAAVLLGAGYGLCLIVGLREVEQLAAPDELGATVAVFYCLAYSGLAVPFLLALDAPYGGYPAGLLAAAGVVAVTALALLAAHRVPAGGSPAPVRARTAGPGGAARAGAAPRG